MLEKKKNEVDSLISFYLNKKKNKFFLKFEELTTAPTFPDIVLRIFLYENVFCKSAIFLNHLFLFYIAYTKLGCKSRQG